ncbi:MAG: DUF4293 domain-containing protein [Mucinivorans sp.]
MIQRKQTLYLLVIFGLLLSMMFLRLTTAVFEAKESQTVEADGSVNRTVVLSDSTAQITMWALYYDGHVAVPFYYLGVLLSLSVALSAAIILFFRRRIVQIRLCFALGVLLVGLIGFLVFYNVRLGQSGGVMSYSVANVFPLICLVLLWLAYRGIIKDEALVRSLDRLR